MVEITTRKNLENAITEQNEADKKQKEEDEKRQEIEETMLFEEKIRN